MQNISQKIVGAEHLSEVIAYLKNADKLIRQGDVHRALDEIVHAREKNPTIMYARAYEEYVRSVLIKQTAGSEHVEGQGSKELVIQQLMPTLEKILDLAIKEVKRSAVTAYKQKEVYAMQKQHEEEQRNEAQLRKVGTAKKISDYLKRARELESHNDFHTALNEIARAFMLDPTDERIQQIEEEIKQSLEKYSKRQEIENTKKQKEEEQRRVQLVDSWQQQREEEKARELKNKEEAYKQARAQKIREYLQIARKLFSEGKLEEAVGQLAFLMVLDPLNEEVLSLNWKIREEQEKQHDEKLAQKKQKIVEEKKKEESIQVVVKNNLEKAEEFLKQQKFSEALRIITQAYYIDPSNQDVVELENRIMAEEDEAIRKEEERKKREEEERKRQQESELHRLTIEQQKREQVRERIEMEEKLLREEEEVLLCLSKARGYLSRGSHSEALEQIANAFKINPFDSEIAKLQREILDAQKKSKLVKKIAMQAPVEQESPNDEEVSEAIALHVEKAKELSTSNQFKEALDEIAKAYGIDPMNEEVFALEGEIQQAYLQHEELHQREEDSSKKNRGIKKSLAKARDALSRDAFSEAFGWVDYAMSFDMQNLETLQMRDEIEKAQRKSEEKKANEDKEVVIQFHLSKAMEFLSEKRNYEAIFEVDLALRLNPDHKGALQLKEKVNSSDGDSVSE